MWRRILRPDALFLLGTLQGLLPYSLFLLQGYPPQYHFELSFYPMAIWIIGYICFWIGTRFGPRDVPAKLTYSVPISFSVLKTILSCLLLVGVGEVMGLMKLYGGIPLLAFANGDFDVDSSNAAQLHSGFGQVGAAALTVYLLMGVIILLAVKARLENVRIARWTLLPLMFTLLISSFNGKRQGILMCLVMIACCSAIAFGSPVDLLSSFLPIRLTRRVGFVIALGVFALVLEGLSALVTLRTLGTYQQSTTEGLTLYYEWPIMNMSQQTIVAGGFGPYEFRPLALFSSLLPAKTSVAGSSYVQPVPRVERSSPSGFYENLQWDTGLWGIIPFCLGCGAFSQYMYRRAFSRYAALLTYSLMAWALFSAPLYNHFLNLLFLPLPALIFFAASASHRTVRGALLSATTP